MAQSGGVDYIHKINAFFFPTISMLYLFGSKQRRESSCHEH
jgi:hypothetical protein